MSSSCHHQPSLNFATLAEVLAHTFVGNYHSDRQAFQAIERFIIAQDVLTGHLAADHMLREGMGSDEPLSGDDFNEWRLELLTQAVS